MGNSQNKLENDYLTLSKKKLRLYYREVYKNPYNVNMALEKKYYDKVVSMRTNMLSIEKLGSIDWKLYIINYFERIGKEEKLIWYNELASEVENEVFFSQKKYTSCAFYKDFELKNKPREYSEFAELNEGHPLGDDSKEKLSTPSITSRRINVLRRTKRSPKPCLPFQTTGENMPCGYGSVL